VNSIMAQLLPIMRPWFGASLLTGEVRQEPTGTRQLLLPMSAAQGAATHQGGDYVMMPLTPGAQIDELRRAIGESEQRRQAAEVKLADCERRLGTARQTIAAQDCRIGWLTSEVARLGDAAASTVPTDYARDAARFFSVYSIGGAR
jgi:hypothetical protein